MQQHPIPQNVTQYQFRLVGDMTLKQFLELALGLVLAYLFYASNLIFIFKWPLAILSLFLGFGLAFFPIEERPLDVWITNFMKSIYSPTRYVWQKTLRLPQLFLFQPSPSEPTTAAIKTVKAPVLTRQKVTATDLTSTELTRLASLNALFGTSPVVSTPSASTPPTPRPEVRVRKLSSPAVIFDATRTKPTLPSLPQALEPKNLTLPKEAPTVVLPPSPAQAPAMPSPATPLPTPTPSPSIVTREPRVTTTVAAKTINLPAPPKIPNLVVGMIVGQDGKMIENAIVQIITSAGIPARAIKTNVLGQFYTSTPLGSGDYTIEVEKEGHNFPTTRLTTSGSLIPPLLIKAS